MIRRTRRIFMILVLVLICATAVCFADDSGNDSISDTTAESVMSTEVISDEILEESVSPAAVIDPGLDPQYNISMNIETAFEAGTGVAQCSVVVDTDPGTATTVNMRIVLERLTTNGYVVVKTWRDEVRTFDSFGEASIYRVFALEERGTYRFRTSGTVYNGTTVLDTFTNVTSPTDPY